MTFLAVSSFPVLQLAGFIAVILCGLAGAAMLADVHLTTFIPKRRSLPAFVEREFDVAGALGWPPRRWIIVRVTGIIGGLLLGVWSHIPLLIAVGAMGGFFGVRFLFAGRAATRRLKMERAFLGELRNLRDRMSLSNQSLDTALQEIGRAPAKELEYILAPLARPGSVQQNIVEVGIRSRSPVVEYACGVLLWARSRSLDALIEAIDDVLLPVGEAQLAVQEEALTTLSQQRAVTYAMTLLMSFMFVVVVRVDAFAAYYHTLEGSLVLLLIVGLFVALVYLVGVIVRVEGWTRWDLRKLAAQQEKLGV